MGHHFLAIHYKYGQYRFAVISETPSNILCVFYVVSYRKYANHATFSIWIRMSRIYRKSYYIKWVTTFWTYSIKGQNSIDLR